MGWTGHRASRPGCVMTSLAPLEVEVPVWADHFAGIAAVASNLAPTPFVPASLRVYASSNRLDVGATAANVAAAILTGDELGLRPMASLRAIYVVNGTPAIYAVALRGLVQSRGHHVRIVEATNSRVILEGRRRDDPVEDAQRVTWTIEDAKQRNLAGKPNWRSQPRHMLIARATADLCRLIAADVVLAMPYVVEEIQDPDELDDALEGPEASNGKTAKRTARRRQTPALSPPVLDDPPTDPEPPAAIYRPVADVQPDPPPPGPPGSVVMMTPEQRRAMMAGFRELEILDRTERLRLCRQITGRDKLASSSDLTFGEARQILAELELRRARAVDSVTPPQSERSDDEGPSEREFGEDNPDPDA